MNRKTIPVCCPSLWSSPLQETGRNNCPKLQPERKTHTHQTQLEALQHILGRSHYWDSFFLLTGPDYCLFLFDWWVTSSGFPSTEHRSHLRHILSLTYWKSIVTGYFLSLKEKGLERLCHKLHWNVRSFLECQESKKIKSKYSNKTVEKFSEGC